MLKSVKLKSVFLFVTMLGTFGLFAQDNQVSEAELTKFANAYIELQVQNQTAQQKMVQIIEAEGIEVQRFSAIQQASMNPELKVEATDEEIKMHQSAIEKIQKLQPELEKEASQRIIATGLTMERFEALAGLIQNDKSLQQRVEAILMKSQE